MLLKAQKNITDLILGTGAAQSATTVAALTAGQWGFANESNVILNTGAAFAAQVTHTGVKILYRSSDGTIISTPLIKTANAKYSSAAYSAPTEQVSYFGYVGSGTETIEAIDNNDYLVRVIMKGITAQYGDKIMYKFGAYRSSNAASMREVALGIATNLTVNFKRERIFNGEQLVRFEVLTEFAAGSQDMTGNSYAVNGDTTVAVDNITVAVLGTLVVGDYLRFDSVGGGAPGPTDGVYRITSITGTTSLTLDRPFELASGTYALTDVQGISAAQAAADLYWGVRATGIARAKFSPGVFNYEKVRFELQLADFGTTVITNVTTPSEGVGFQQEVRELEWFYKGNRSDGLRLGVPPPVFTTDVVTTTNYGYAVIEYFDDSYTGINATPRSPATAVIAIPTANLAATVTIINTQWALAAL